MVAGRSREKASIIAVKGFLKKPCANSIKQRDKAANDSLLLFPRLGNLLNLWLKLNNAKSKMYGFTFLLPILQN